MTTTKLDELFLQFEALEETMKPLEKQRDYLKDEIKKALAETKLGSYSAGKVQAYISDVTRVMYDSKKLEEIFKPEELEPAKKTITYSQCTVKMAKEKEEGGKNEN
jgi:hypothetical protein